LVIGALVCALVAPAAAEEPASPAPAEAPAASPERVQLVPANERLVITYRWPRWIPWTVLGGGAALAGIGLAFNFSGSSRMNDYDQRIASSCAVNGCNLSNPQTPAEQAFAAELNDLRESAETRQTIGLVTLLAAGAGLVTGVVLVVLNRPEAHTLKVDLVPQQGGATATVGWHF
jgi:hypothetical protein